MHLLAHFVDLHQDRIYPVRITVHNAKLTDIEEVSEVPADAGYLLPGFIDAHVHIESSMLPPAEFARLAVVHGTVATVSDPHEIANVLGSAGVKYMIDEAERVPFKFCFGAPSCVPATPFETAGAALSAKEVSQLLAHPDIGYLSEMMNFPGVLHKDAEVMAKIKAAQRLGKPVDGHAPGLRGDDAAAYFGAGITTDHECFTYEEGREKAQLGVKIIIREGSAARNFEALWPLIREFPEQIMFGTDDKHPDDLIHGHINELVARAVAKGCDRFDVLRAACIHPIEHYGLAVGQVRKGDPADFIIVEDLERFAVRETWINGRCVARNKQSLLAHQPSETPNHFLAQQRKPADFVIPAGSSDGRVRVIGALDGQIVTEAVSAQVPVIKGNLCSDKDHDILTIAVINRYTASAPVALGFVSGFGLRRGALASSVAHDSHNIVAVGTDTQSLCLAVNAVIDAGGGISATDGIDDTRTLPLPIAGLMSPMDGYQLADTYAAIDRWSKEKLGCKLQAPFMVLSFLALPVIPSLKMTDRGLFDVGIFDFVSVTE